MASNNPFQSGGWEVQPLVQPFSPIQHVTSSHCLHPGFAYFRPVQPDCNQFFRIAALAIFKRVQRFSKAIQEVDLLPFQRQLKSLMFDQSIDLERSKDQLLAELLRADKLAAGFALQRLILKMFDKYMLVDILGVMIARVLVARQPDLPHIVRLECYNFFKAPPSDYLSTRHLGIQSRLITSDADQAGELNIWFNQKGKMHILYFPSHQIQTWLNRPLKASPKTGNKKVNKSLVRAQFEQPQVEPDAQPEQGILAERVYSPRKPVVEFTFTRVKSRTELAQQQSEQSTAVAKLDQQQLKIDQFLLMRAARLSSQQRRLVTPSRFRTSRPRPNLAPLKTKSVERQKGKSVALKDLITLFPRQLPVSVYKKEVSLGNIKICLRCGKRLKEEDHQYCKEGCGKRPGGEGPRQAVGVRTRRRQIPEMLFLPSRLYS